MSSIRAIMTIGIVCCAMDLRAADAFYSLPLTRLELTEGSPPSRTTRSQRLSQAYLQAMQPYAVINGPGEVYFDVHGIPVWYSTNMLLRAPAGEDVTGQLYFPRRDLAGMVKLKFRVSADWNFPHPSMPFTPREAFARARQSHYEKLWKRGIPGAAWFRRQAMAEMSLERHSGGIERQHAGLLGPSVADLQTCFALFSGGWAVSENLQLERSLPPSMPNNALVDVTTLPGIDVPEYNWQPSTEDPLPDLDPLAEKIPADQHAFLFPNLDAVTAVRNWLQHEGAVIVQLAQLRSIDRAVTARYERQLGLSFNAASKSLAAPLAQSLAFTGSDPYYAMGTDVAIILETAAPEALAALLLGTVRFSAAGIADSQAIRGEVHGIPYQGIVTSDREISSYVAALGRSVVLTNSLYQLERLASVQRGDTASLASLPEYAFFRNRYRRSEESETGLLVLSDATIRRWCGPRWRIGNARRMSEASRLVDARAAKLDELIAGQAQSDPPSEFGNLTFMKPIAELDLDQVSLTESSAYAHWRDGYQHNWRVAFDPIGIRLGVSQKRLTADVSVMPLSLSSRYRELVQISAGATLAPDAGDPHGALVHGVLAVNGRSGVLQELGRSLQRSLNADAVGWLGPTVAIYAEDGPFWEEFPGRGRGLGAFIGPQGMQIPVTVRADVASRLRLATLLKALPEFVERNLPGMTEWETRIYREQSYVRIFPAARANQDRIPWNFTVYYAALGDVLFVTLQEEILRKAIDRELARQAEVKNPFAPVETHWLGGNVGLHVDGKMLQALAGAWQDDYQAWMQTQAWDNLPILNEWKRRFPDRDPLVLHQEYWHAQIVCPGGGEYVWSDEWQTYESTVYGHPGQPKFGPVIPPALGMFQTADFGLTFESDGLRARILLQR